MRLYRPAAFFLSESIMDVFRRVHDLSPHGACTKQAAAKPTRSSSALVKVPVGAAVGIPKRDERWRHEHFRHTLAKCKRLVDG